MRFIKRNGSHALISLAAFLGLAVSTAGLADKAADATVKASSKQRQKTYIVQMKSDPIASYDGRIRGLAATKPAKGAKVDPQSTDFKRYAAHLQALHDNALNAVGGGRKVYDYRVVFNGFAAVLTPEQVEALKTRGDVLNVWEDKKLKPQTNSTRHFLRLTGDDGPWAEGFVGENVVIGMIDTGIQPDHPGLADVPTPKKGNHGPKVPYGPPPAGFTGTGCDFGNTAFNPLDAPFTCNNKLLKAQSFPAGFLAGQSPATAFAAGEFDSARDSDGHGTHTSTTAGGNFGVKAEIDGERAGILSGMAPRARIATYKVCYDAPDPNDSGCTTSDSAAAIDQAVADGVDVINFSIGGPSTSFTGVTEIAFLFAADAGVFVAVSAGNAGPGAETIGTPSGVPWVTSVGASEDNENFGTGLEVNSPVSIAAVYEGLEGAGDVTLADAGTIAAGVVPAVPLDGCAALTNGGDIDGNIALVIRGTCAFTDKYNNAAAAGARAIVVYNDGTTPDRFDPITMSAPGTTIPGIMIGFLDGDLINTTAGGGPVTGTLSPDIQVPRVNRITGFSSRGPNGGAPDIIKPDVTAPGVNIIAGETLFPNVNNTGGTFFQFLSGTSMSSPHTAGSLALLKQAHPDWSAAIARSALMTTARRNLRESFGDDKADPFDIGAGFIRPRGALNPGLAYDAGFLDYLAFLCGAENQILIVDPADCAFLESIGFSLDSSDLNLPSIGIADLVGTQTIRRTVTNVGKHRKRYHVTVKEPPGIDVSVSPSVIHLKKGESATYEVTFTATNEAVSDEWAFGSLAWRHGHDDHNIHGHDDHDIVVRSPIAVRPVSLAAPDEVTAEGTDGTVSFDVQFGYTGDYQVGVDGLTAGGAQPATVADGDFNQHDFDVPLGTTLARFSLFDEDTGTGAGTDDLDIQVFGPESAGFPFLGQSAGATSEEEFDIVNPEPGIYAVLVIDFATEPGDTPYTQFNFNLDGNDSGNTTVTTPTAVVGTTGTVDVEWQGLAPGTRHLAILNHSDGVETIGETELLINTQ